VIINILNSNKVSTEMKNPILTFLISLMLNGSLMAQVAFERIYNATTDMAYSVVQTSDSGYMMTGQIDNSGTGKYDVFLLKTNNIGETLWTKTYDFAENDCGSSLLQSDDGGYIITGWTQNAFPSNSRMFIITPAAAAGPPRPFPPALRIPRRARRPPPRAAAEAPFHRPQSEIEARPGSTPQGTWFRSHATVSGCLAQTRQGGERHQPAPYPPDAPGTRKR
jgi:hypothetical protein